MVTHLYHLIFFWQNFERNQSFSTKKPPLFESWSWIFFRYKKFFRDFLNFRTFISSELHLKKFSAKSEYIFGNHHPSVTLKKYRGQKWADPACKLKPKKHLLGWDIRQKEIKLGPHRGPLKMVHFREINIKGSYGPLAVGFRSYSQEKKKDEFNKK